MIFTKINYIKINNFGKLNNKEINFDNINLINGKNESGKTTLLKFINGMFYGISKNKNGNDISDLEKYNPWNNEEYSGKISYELDNKETFEVFRDFNKKNPKIYNSNLEDISNEFNIDKNKQNQFFYDQTKIDENLFLSTTIVEQEKTVLDINSQNNLVQKIANMLSSGDDNTSYKKITDKLNKKIVEEIGTDRTKGRPINLINDEIKDLENKINILENNGTNKNELNDRINNKNEEINLLEQELFIYKEIKEKKENEKLDLEKINFNNNIKKEYEYKISEIEKNIINNNEDNIDKGNEDKINNTNKKKLNLRKLELVLLPILIILNIIIDVTNINNIFKIITFILSLGIATFLEILIMKNNNKHINNKEEINQEKINDEPNTYIERIKQENEIEILKNNINKIENENILELNKIEENRNIQINYLIDKYKDILNNEEIKKIYNKDLSEIKKEIEELETRLNNNKIEINTLNIEENNLNERMDEYSEIEERLEYLYLEKENLINLNKKYELINKCLEQAYYNMKKNVTPKFTKDLSSIVEKISNGKYKNVNFKADEGLIVELENGEYINANRLSIGTIDQLYLSLRLSTLKNISEENMPIILDESFAYYDNERLENILKYLCENYKDNQIIIFTCNNREKEIFDKLQIKYNLINL